MNKNIYVQKNIPCKMRDGTILYSDIYSKDNHSKNPVLICRTPYDKTRSTYTKDARTLASNEYTVIVQDVRGRFESEGEFVWMWENKYLTGDAEDAYDTIEWASKLNLCDGTIGTWGHSNPSWHTWMMLLSEHPNLKSALSSGMAAKTLDLTRGIFETGRRLEWTYQLASPIRKKLDDKSGPYEQLEAIKQWNRVERGKYIWWTPLSTLPKEPFSTLYDPLVKLMKNSHGEMQDFSDVYPKVKIPIMHITGWWDRLIGTVDTFIGLDKQKNQIKNYHKLIIGPWGHDNGNFKGNIGPVNYGKEADESYSDLIIKWYDHQFKDKKLIFPENKRVKLFILGNNKWEYYSEWPPNNSKDEIYYLHSNGDANVKNSNGILSNKLPKQEPPDIYKYDPRDPVMSLMLQNSQTVPMDQRPNHNRNDILLYETEKFTSATKFIGNPIVKLWASSDAKDTDWVVKLAIVYEDDMPVNLCYEILRAKYRNSYENDDLIPNTNPIEYTIKLRPLGINVLKGQKLRLYVASSDFPNHDRNHNTGNDFWDDFEFKIATQKIYHDLNYPSRLILPKIKN